MSNPLFDPSSQLQSAEPNPQQVWIDVGCHLGETTLDHARQNCHLKVYAFEPNLKLAAQLVDQLPNYCVIPVAVSSQDGVRAFYRNAADTTSFPLPANPKSLEQKTGGESLPLEEIAIVPTIRLDTFLDNMAIESVDFLKIDAQGADFDVILSAGERIKDITKIKLEVAITPTQLDAGAHDKTAVVNYLTDQGFILIQTEKQSHDQEENLTFVCIDRLLTLPDLAQYIPCLDQPIVLDLAEQVTCVRPLGLYPGWYFNIEWGSLNRLTQLRQAIWEYFRTKRIEGVIRFPWYDNLQLLLHLGNDLSSQLFIAGCYEPNELYFLSQVLESGMTFVDVGANDGIYSLLASRYVGDDGLVLAFEPSQREFRNLKIHIELNQIQNIRPFPIAASNSTGEVVLKVANDEHAGQNTLGEFVHQGVFCTQTEAVPVKRLDDVVAELDLQRLDVIKLDTEGAEFLVLQGAQAVLQRFHPLLILELSDDALKTQGSSAAAVLQYLRSLGYDIFTFGPYTGVPLQANEGTKLSNNIVAAHPCRGWRGLTESEQMQQLQIELNQTQTHLHETQHRLELSHTDLKQAQMKIQTLQTQLNQTESQLQQSQAQMEQLQQQLGQQLAQQQQTIKAEMEALQTQLQQVEAQTRTLRDIINAMESSKFWQLRNAWLHLRERMRPGQKPPTP